MAKSSKSIGAVLHPIGQLYGQWVFNFMVDIAGAIAFDFTDRPQHYRSVPDELGRLLTGFRSSMGSHPDWPDAQQRIANFRVLGTACLAGVPLREAALVYVQSGTEETRDLLAEAFRDTAESFRAQMRTVDGQSLRIACRQNETIFDAARRLFQSEPIMGAFNLAPAPRDDGWPMAGHLHGEGSDLAAELIRAMDGGIVARALLGGPKREVGGSPAPRALRISMPQNKFILLQQAAWYGALTMSGAMADSYEKSDLRDLIGNAYKWTKALQRLVPDVARAWKDPNYRMRLTDVEWGMVEPHPSGEVNLQASGGRAGGFFYSTATIWFEVCCCTGDLPCPASSNCEISPGPSCINCGSLAVVKCGLMSPI